MSKDKDKALPELGVLRQKIDELDSQIVELLNKRAKVVVDVGEAKRARGVPSYAPEREHVVLERIAEFNKGPLPQKTLQAIYRELMSGSFTLEKPLRIGYLGPEGSFSQMAAQRKFGASVEYLPLADIRAVFDEVARSHCDLGLGLAAQRAHVRPERLLNQTRMSGDQQDLEAELLAYLLDQSRLRPGDGHRFAR